MQAALVKIATLNYPYPTNFTGTKLPANPLLLSCNKLHEAVAKGASPLQQLHALVTVTWSVPSTGCTILQNSTWAYLPGLIPGAWSYERCSEVIIPCEVTDTNPAFLSCSQYPPNCYNSTEFGRYCTDHYVTTPITPSLDLSYGTANEQLSAYSRVVFTNGYLDPWSSGGYLPNDSSVAHPIYWMQGAAHHLDLRVPDDSDPVDVVRVRKAVANDLREWLIEYIN